VFAPKGATTKQIARPRRSTPKDLPVAAALFYFRSRLLNGTPDQRYEHPYFHAPATRELPNSGKTGLTIKSFFAFCSLPFAFCFSEGCFGAAKADIIVAVIGIVMVADGARHFLWLIVPRAATNYALSVCPMLASRICNCVNTTFITT